MGGSTKAPSADSEILCQLKWTLASSHSWSGPMPKRDLVDYALDSADQGRGKELCERLKQKSYITWQRGQGFRIKTSPAEQAKLAYELRDECDISELRIQAKLSRFNQTGGFADW